MSLTEAEKNRRESKKMYEVFDSHIGEMLKDKEFAGTIMKAWAKADPKGFMQIAQTRLPKVQPVDQDLQKTYISLKAMMQKLPDTEDIIGENHSLKTKLGLALMDVERLEREIKDMRKVLNKRSAQ